MKKILGGKTTSAKRFPNHILDRISLHYVMRDDCVQVDELLRQLADYKNDVADMAAEKLLRKCSSSWEAYQYLKDRVHDSWLPDPARQQMRQIIKKIQVQLHQRQEYGWAYEPV